MDSGSALNNLVDKSVVHRFLGGHEVVAVGIFSDYVNGLALVFFARMELRVSLVRRMWSAWILMSVAWTLHTAERLMNHNLAVRESESLALSSG